MAPRVLTQYIVVTWKQIELIFLFSVSNLTMPPCKSPISTTSPLLSEAAGVSKPLSLDLSTNTLTSKLPENVLEPCTPQTPADIRAKLELNHEGYFFKEMFHFKC